MAVVLANATVVVTEVVSYRVFIVVKTIVPVVVLVPPVQEVLILFFKSLIKRIKIDINMTKLQVLGELL